MTAPPWKATRRAESCPEERAASTVLTLVLVAAYIPKKPARTEQTAPLTKAAAVARSRKAAINAATRITNNTRMLY